MEGITGTLEVTREGWVHIRLDTLLPNCRYRSAAPVGEAVYSILERHKENLPFYDTALLVIEERSCDTARCIYDHDNKAWKAIPNAMKGILFEDDDDRTLSYLLLTGASDMAECHIYVMPPEDGSRFLKRRFNGAGMPPASFFCRFLLRLGCGGALRLILRVFSRMRR